MFWTHKIKISSQDETRVLTEIYGNIDAQIYKQNVRLNNDISENTNHEITIVLISADKINIKEGNQIEYTDEFGIIRKLKITGMDFIPALHFNKLIEIKCDLI